MVSERTSDYIIGIGGADVSPVSNETRRDQPDRIENALEQREMWPDRDVCKDQHPVTVQG